MSKQGISVKGTMDYEAVVAFLDDFVASFKKKTVCVQRGEEFVTLTPGEQVEVEIEAQEKKGKQKLSMEFTWRSEVPLEGDMSFKVSATEPEIKTPAPAAEAGDAAAKSEAVSVSAAPAPVKEEPADKGPKAKAVAAKK